jgi:YegS/Rv2252/BmrU family lipid kinase
MKILLLVNRNARRGAEPLDPALAVFAQAGVEVETVAAADSLDAAKAIAAAVGRLDAIVMAGGDGTLNNALATLIEAGLPVGVLPMGTANDLARSLNLPLAPAPAAEVIVAGNVRRIDVGEVNGALFLNVAHIGLGAILATRLTGAMKRWLGPFAYGAAAARSLRLITPFRAELITPSERLALRTYNVTVGNGRYFGGSALVAEDAEIDDGVFHAFALATKNPLRLAMMLPKLLRGRVGDSSRVRTLIADKVEVRTVRPLPIRADGMRIGETPALFRVRPGALAVFAPPRPAPIATP